MLSINNQAALFVSFNCHWVVVVGSNKGDPMCINKISRIYVTLHPPVHHPLEIHYEPIVDEPQMSSSTIKVNSSSKPAYFTLPLPVYTLNPTYHRQAFRACKWLSGRYVNSYLVPTRQVGRCMWRMVSQLATSCTGSLWFTILKDYWCGLVLLVSSTNVNRTLTIELNCHFINKIG